MRTNPIVNLAKPGGLTRRQWLGLAGLAFTSRVGGAEESAGSVCSLRAGVAANFKETHEAIAKLFVEKTGSRVETVSGSTGKLFAQIHNGAPYDVLLSADQKHVELLIAEGLAVRESRVSYAEGRLALFSRTIELKGDWQDAVSAAPIQKFAIANPEVAPYGSAAIEALRHVGLYDALSRKFVFGESIAQALQFVESGAADAGLVAYAQVKSRHAGEFLIVDRVLHTPVVQDAVLLTHGVTSPCASAFLEFLRSGEACTLIKTAGYDIPQAAAEN